MKFNLNRIQPVKETRSKQLEHWRLLIISYQKSISSFRLSPTTFPFFKNENLDRRLSFEGIDSVIDYLIEKGNAEWEDSSRSTLFIYYKSLATLADELYFWVDSKAQIDNVLTVYELYSGTEFTDTPLLGLDAFVVRRVLETLEKKNKCIYIHGETSADDGVKFVVG